MQRVAILNSRQRVRPCGSTPWVMASCHAVRWVIERGMRVVSSLGLPNWDMVTCVALKLGGVVDLVVPQVAAREMKLRQQAEAYFGSHLPSEWCFHGMNESMETAHRRQRWALRDARVVQLADLLMPIALRPRGGMARHVEAAGRGGVDRSFEISYDDKGQRLAYEVAPEKVNPDLGELNERFLMHYTRAVNGPWPDETVVDYWGAVTASEAYPREALATLLHIATTRRLIGSGRHMPERIPCVSFTSLPVAEAISLMRWRSRYHEMSLEPYGIALERSVAAAIGIRPVEYYDSSGAEPSAGTVRSWYTQSIGKTTDWRAEAEWRARGDVDLTRVPAGAIRLLCHTPDEVPTLSERTGYETIAITR